MIKQVINIPDYDWKVYVYYNISYDDKDEIIDKLYKYNFPKTYISSAYTILSNNKLNQGFTFSNTNNKTSIIGITNTTNASQFINTFIHEIHHTVSHISITYDLNPTSEEVCYIAGSLAETMYDKCNTLLCDCCRHN